MRSKLIILFLVLPLVVLALGCEDPENKGEIRKEAINTRWELFRRAEALYPIPQTANFPLRQALVEYTVRQDQPSHPWYIYVIADTGNIIGYYVGKTAPQSTCNFLSSTEDIVDKDDSEFVLTAPSLDGIYYGGAGASSSCAMSFFFDYETNALIMVPSIRLFVTDQPLRVEADPIEVQSAGVPNLAPEPTPTPAP